jgi:thiol-disulfide isomerase/thioredoxin
MCSVNRNCMSIRKYNFRKFGIKTISLFLICIIIQVAMQAQDKGMQFVHNSNWTTIVAKAKAENKYIFVDCFTTWCGPCKYMSINIFPLEEVGNFYNAKFINVKFQIDTTAGDDTEVKSRYSDAAFISSKYNIKAYPTYLIFNSDGELVHREIGSSSAAEFITKGSNALDPQKQYYTQVKKYVSGQRDSQFLKKLTILAMHAYDEDARSQYAKDYLLTKPDLHNRDNLHFIYETTRAVSDTGFSLIMNNPGLFETAVDKEELWSSLESIILRSEYQRRTDWEKMDSIEWDNYKTSLSKKYPLFVEAVWVQLKTNTFQIKGDWAAYAATVDNYIKNQTPLNGDLNNYAWTIFLGCNDRKILESALQWSKMSFANQKKIEPGYIDTYANLSYKLGRKEEALDWELKAQKIAIEQGNDKNWGQDVIDKINKGEKTW